MAEKRFYWLKLKRDFFKRHDIRIIESMPNGKDYILFYLKLLCESVDHDGNLRFSDQIPYSEEMLSTITSTNIDIVRSAIKIFTQLEMMEIMDDGTFYMREVERMLGSETAWAEKKRVYRESHKLIEDNVQTMSEDEGTMSDKSKSKRESKSKSKSKRFTPPTVDEVRAYCQERGNNVDPEYFIDFYEARDWKISGGRQKMSDWKASVRTWERNNFSKPKGKVGANGVKVTGDSSDILDGIL